MRTGQESFRNHQSISTHLREGAVVAEDVSETVVDKEIYLGKFMKGAAEVMNILFSYI